MKVNTTLIAIPKKPAYEVSVGDILDNAVVTEIDEAQQATWITVRYEDGKCTTYGSKIFINKFKS